MRNLCYFCHYHRGDKREKTLKIGGSVLVATALFLVTGAVQVSMASERASGFLSALLPEPGYLITAEGTADQGAINAQPVQPAPSTTSTTESAPPAAQPSPILEPVKGPDPEMKPEEDHERFEEQNTLRWRQDKLREWRDQLREVSKIRKQLVRLKGSQDELAQLDAVKARLEQCQSQLNAASGAEAMKDVLEGEDCGDTGELWEEINRIRQAVELPKELNNILRDLNRFKKICAQKWVDKVFSRSECATIMDNFSAKYGEAKAAYQAGEYEDARSILQENFHEPGWPGDVSGALQMLRGFMEPLRRIKDNDLKGQLTEMTDQVKELLRSGDYREARETMDAIQREVGQKIFQLIFNSERNRRAIPENVFEKIERLQQKFEALEKQAPTEAAPSLPETAPAPQPVQ